MSAHYATEACQLCIRCNIIMQLEQMACQRGNPTSCTHIDWHARLVYRGQAQHKRRITRLVSIRAFSVALQKDGVVDCCNPGTLNGDRFVFWANLNVSESLGFRALNIQKFPQEFSKRPTLYWKYPRAWIWGKKIQFDT